MTQRDFYVGLLHFNEAFGLELGERIKALDPIPDPQGNLVNIKTEHVLIHEIPVDYQTRYQLIIDRGSHLLRQAVGIFMIYAFQGVHIINNPLSFHYFISNKDVGFAIAHSLGIKVPSTYILPAHSNTMLNSQEDFMYHRHFDWNTMMQKIGWPCYIKPAEGRGAFAVDKVYDMQELWQCYNGSGEKIMTIQSAIDSPHNWHIRCLSIGRSIIPMKFIFRSHDRSQYIWDENFLSAEQRAKVINSSRIINRLFGYEMNSVEFVLDSAGEPWAIDFNNPIPDARKQMLGDHYYDDYMNAMVERIIEVACTRPRSLFLPNVNEFSAISQMDLPVEDKFQAALKIANQFYEPEEVLS